MIQTAHKLATQLAVGDTVLGTERNPNCRGTVTAVHRFGCPTANKLPSRVPGGKPIKHDHDPHDSKTLAVRTPPSSQEARVIAKEVAHCYGESEGSVSITIAGREFSMPANTQVNVWVPLSDALAQWQGR